MPLPLTPFSGRTHPNPEDIQIWVCLCNPSDIRNIGGAIRAIANYGLTGIKIISSQSLDERSLYYFSSESYSSIRVQRYTHLDEALESATYVIGTSRRIHGPHAPPTYSAYHIHQELDSLWKTPQGLHLLFGNERTGLVQEELDVCQAIIEIPTFERFPSMNLSHAVACISHEVSRALYLNLIQNETHSVADSNHPPALPSGSTQNPEVFELKAPPQASQAFFQQITQIAQNVGYPPGRTAESFTRKIRALLRRANPTAGEYGLILGVFRELERIFPYYAKSKEELDQEKSSK